MSNEILIRCIGMTAGKQRVRNMKPAIANNALLMRESGYVISDPNYDEKMRCFREKKPFTDECCGGVCKTVTDMTPTLPETETISTPKKRGRKPKLQTA